MLLQTSSGLSLLTSLFWDYFYHSTLLGTFQQLFSSLWVTHSQKVGFFLRISLCKIGILFSQLAEVGQAGGTTNHCRFSWAQMPAQPTSLITPPLTQRWDLSVIPTAGSLSALHSTHTHRRKWRGCFSCSHRVWTLLNHGCETPQCFVLLNVGFDLLPMPPLKKYPNPNLLYYSNCGLRNACSTIMNQPNVSWHCWKPQKAPP